eukprot:TRINITY_DN3159_c0_g1_i4.p1 TRINITY_DN3159_c0_g1~~TRINITY_DN3159_c0_g1_i4.p1  ORF type:complete len:149 (-),score=13.01 TRINITY_DN3159_c0_g1_i4:163-609(-)
MEAVVSTQSTGTRNSAMNTNCLPCYLCVFLFVFFVSTVYGSAEHRQFIEDTVKSHSVVIFSKSYCPYCRRAKSTIESTGNSYYAVELDLRSDGSTIQSALHQMTGQRTVPSVWIHGKFIGGSDKVVSLHTAGKLAGLLSPPKHANDEI